MRKTISHQSPNLLNKETLSQLDQSYMEIDPEYPSDKYDKFLEAAKQDELHWELCKDMAGYEDAIMRINRGRTAEEMDELEYEYEKNVLGIW